MADIGNAEHLQHRRAMGHGIISLDAAGVQPGEMNGTLAQFIAQAHVVGQHVNRTKADPFEGAGDIARHRFVAFPGTGVGCFVDDVAGDALIAAVDHGDVHLALEALDLTLQLTTPSLTAGRVIAGIKPTNSKRRFLLKRLIVHVHWNPVSPRKVLYRLPNVNFR